MVIIDPIVRFFCRREQYYLSSQLRQESMSHVNWNGVQLYIAQLLIGRIALFSFASVTTVSALVLVLGGAGVPYVGPLCELFVLLFGAMTLYHTVLQFIFHRRNRYLFSVLFYFDLHENVTMQTISNLVSGLGPDPELTQEQRSAQKQKEDDKKALAELGIGADIGEDITKRQQETVDVAVQATVNCNRLVAAIKAHPELNEQEQERISRMAEQDKEQLLSALEAALENQT